MTTTHDVQPDIIIGAEPEPTLQPCDYCNEYTQHYDDECLTCGTRNTPC